jgi:electron transfer flavoprotein alpha subunit
VVDLLETAVAESQAQVILGSSTADVTDALARLAVRLDTGLISGAVAISTDLVVTKSVLAGSYTTTSELNAAPGPAQPLIITYKPNSIDPQRVETLLAPGEQPEVNVLSVRPSVGGVEILERTALEVSARPALAEARVVVAGGRGVEGDFTPLEELADELGAGLGASRAATDAGWIEHAAQIGQTGVTVSPQLYISAGISGAIQQRAGMQTAGTIVAINKDEDAPVFEIADFGVVGDLHEVIPQMVEELRRRKG